MTEEVPSAPRRPSTRINPSDGPSRTASLATVSLVLGILSYACLGILASIPAVICGHLGLGRIRRDPELGGRGFAIAGLVLGYVNIVLVVLAVALLIPGLAAARNQARQVVSLSQLREIGIATHMYAEDHNFMMPSTWEQIVPYLPLDGAMYDPETGQIPETLLVPGATDTSQPSYEILIDEPVRVEELTDPSVTPYIREREAFWNGERNVLYFDGHVDRIDESAAPSP